MPIFSSFALLSIGSVALVGHGVDAYANRHDCATAPTWDGGATFELMGVNTYTESPGAVCEFLISNGTDIECGDSMSVLMSTDNSFGYGMKVAVLGGATVSDTATSPTTSIHNSNIPDTCLGSAEGSARFVSGVELEIDTSTIVSNGDVELVGLCGNRNEVMYVVKQTFNVVGCDIITGTNTESPTSAPTPTPTAEPTFPPTTTPTVMPSAAPSTASPTSAPNTSAPTSGPTTSTPTTSSPTAVPTLMPTTDPTAEVFISETTNPTSSPTLVGEKSTNAPTADSAAANAELGVLVATAFMAVCACVAN